MRSKETSMISESEQICGRYQQLYAGVIYDVLEHLGYPHQVLAHDISPLIPDMKLAGPAFTIKGTMSCERNEAGRYKRLEMIRRMQRPCVEVRDCGTPHAIAMYGELSATTAAAHGAVGALVDGGTRDTARLISMGFPVFARYRTPIEAFGRWVMLDCQVPVLLSGELTDTVQVNPGDFIFGDYDGVLVIPQDLTLKVLIDCERITGIENQARAAFARGEDPVEVFQRYKRL
ncbi:MAG TPA: RraA family protein [Acidobacteriota bacterium]|jgi:regulator of RNase E activity RraA|nr:RraA family protein [Acidobacteriota bacterium]